MAAPKGIDFYRGGENARERWGTEQGLGKTVTSTIRSIVLFGKRENRTATGNLRRKDRFSDEDLILGKGRLAQRFQLCREIRFRYAGAGRGLDQNASGLLFSQSCMGNEYDTHKHTDRQDEAAECGIWVWPGIHGRKTIPNYYFEQALWAVGGDASAIQSTLPRKK